MEKSDSGNSFDEFIGEVSCALGSAARSKGYYQGLHHDWADKNPSFEFIRDYVDEDHALGEMVYKVLRYKSQSNKEDLIKIAAWAFLEWKFGKGGN